jgi:F0F1-type ATP synthase assembly protein I
MTDGQPPKTPSGANEGWTVVGYLISGIVVWGGIGWLLDEWLDTRIALPAGLIVGMAGGIYLVVKRFG